MQHRQEGVELPPADEKLQLFLARHRRRRVLGRRRVSWGRVRDAPDRPRVDERVSDDAQLQHVGDYRAEVGPLRLQGRHEDERRSLGSTEKEAYLF